MPERYTKKNGTEPGHSHMFCGNTGPILFKRHTAKRLGLGNDHIDSNFVQL
jgi:hypothetical protein